MCRTKFQYVWIWIPSIALAAEIGDIWIIAGLARGSATCYFADDVL